MSDCINRELALSFPWANGKYDHENANEHFIYGLETYKEWLEQLPIVSPKNAQDMGKWIFRYNKIICSKCHKEFTDEACCCDIYGWFWNYCPNCGIKMEEE